MSDEISAPAEEIAAAEAHNARSGPDDTGPQPPSAESKPGPDEPEDKDGDDTDAGSGEDAKARENAEFSESARGLARRSIDRRFTEITREVRGGKAPSRSEAQLLLENNYRHGFPPETYAGFGGKIPVEGGLEITRPDGKIVRIDSLSKPTDADTTGVNFKAEGKTIDDPPEDVTIDSLSGEVLANAQLSTHAEEIAGLFKADGKDTPESRLIAWSAQGANEAPPLSAGEITALNAKIDQDEARDKDPRNIAARVLEEHAVRLQFEINEHGDKAPAETKLLLAQLRIAQGLAGGEIGNWATASALRSLEAHNVEGLAELIGQLTEAANTEIESLKPQLAAAGVTIEEFKSLQEQGLGAILGNDVLTAKFAKMENIDKILGPNMDQDKLISILDKNIPPGHRAAWDKMKSGGKITGGILLAILIGALAIPAAALVGGTQMMASGKR
ncbi:MAG TPA: hypothetical protein VNA13_00700 [Xanthomonadales bacterium]|nr:hypothetical protein [Xanthomonadales bacterium]